MSIGYDNILQYSSCLRLLLLLITFNPGYLRRRPDVVCYWCAIALAILGPVWSLNWVLVILLQLLHLSLHLKINGCIINKNLRILGHDTVFFANNGCSVLNLSPVVSHGSLQLRLLLFLSYLTIFFRGGTKPDRLQLFHIEKILGILIDYFDTCPDLLLLYYWALLVTSCLRQLLLIVRLLLLLFA